MFDYIVDENVKRQILELNNTSFECAYRATFEIESISEKDFLPYNVEKQKAALDYSDPSTYSVSLYLTVDAIEKIKKASRSFRTAHRGIAKGKTDAEKGIANLSNIYTGHIDYYLYDYVNNSPLSDFEVLPHEQVVSIN